MSTQKLPTLAAPTEAFRRPWGPVIKHEPAAATPIGAAVIGYGYWGPNLARNIFERPEFDLKLLCDRDPVQRAAFERRYPAAACERLDEVLDDPTIGAVIIATPPSTHYEIARAALMAGKHVLVEKPLATTLEDATELATIAAASGLVLMPGHTFMYSPAVNTIRELIHSGDVGDIHFVTSSRMNLGKYQPDGVVCDLAPHDISILLHWIDEPVVEVSCGGCSVFQDGVPETAFVTLGFAGGATANLQMSWLAPRKVRQMIVVGSKLMVLYDDIAADEQVRVYDRGMDHIPPANFGEHQLTYRTGDVVIPRIAPAEPLSLEFQDFAHAIRTGQEPRSNVAIGLEVVSILEAAAVSLQEHGTPRSLSPIPNPVPDRLKAA
jgi:predicted dehydrogenase